MSESGNSPDGGAVARELETLERAVEALIEELSTMRRRLAEAEDRSGKLAKTLEVSGVRPGEAADLEKRLSELTDENEHLRAVISQARKKAATIRKRLIVMEDEAS